MSVNNNYILVMFRDIILLIFMLNSDKTGLENVSENNY